MSRSIRAPDDQTKLKKKLNELMKLEGNKLCADCGCRGPRWASINLGVFICIACSGIHRSLGVHLTFVRSINLDSWTMEQVQQMQQWGNTRAKAYYEANIPSDYRIPMEHSSVREKEMWIRDKYERKRFVGNTRDETEQEERGGRRKKQSEDDEDVQEVDERRRERRQNRSGARHSSRPISRESTTLTTATADILSFDVFSGAVPATKPDAPPVAVSAPTTQSKQDEWASFGGSTNTQSGFENAFASKALSPTDHHVNKMANIMASFGNSMQQQPQQQQNAFTSQQGMTSLAPIMGSQMPMMQPRPMGMSMPMNMPMSMPMGGQGFMNPMMGQLPNMMMGYPMQNQMFGALQQNQMFGAPQQNGMIMGAAAPMGFQGQPMRMNPMRMNPMGMQMNHGGFQPQQQRQQQQQQPQPQ
ncbi:unnamed protein product [Peronospora destructor]|uniref:Arf-GAP domain-containing protein n=1 Tax=Peronospora destructor TaxID=86335 RepID=A0AAV0UHJ5_9STRA|nr:unnamed protein product [Peronospora destructor]